ncbi:MAG: DUF4351 domain-containing protein [Goleter apudmare HA4340-LM2]|nr:DUF4351 domain-containing protein [Goleter apudmare HA4340-LM2]
MTWKLGDVYRKSTSQLTLLEPDAWKLACPVLRGERGSNAPTLPDSIMVCKFENKSQREVEEMLGITLRETRVYREIKEEGREEEEKFLILRQLTRRVGELPQQVLKQVEALSLEQSEALGEELLDFTSLDDLLAWLAE